MATINTSLLAADGTSSSINTPNNDVDVEHDSDEEVLGLHEDTTSVGGKVKHWFRRTKRYLVRTVREWQRDPWKVFWRNIFLVTLLALMTTSQIFVKIVSTRVSKVSGGAFALGQAQPIISSISFGIAWCFQLLYYRWRRHKQKSNGGEFEDSDYVFDYSVSKWHMAFVGSFLSIGNVFLFMGSGSNAVPGPVSVLLQQMVIPSTLLISIFWFRTKFYFGHYVGAAIILGGVAVTVFSPSHSGSNNTPPDVSGGTKAWAIFCIVGAAISNAVGLGYLEYRVVFPGNKISLAWMWMWINFFEIFITIPLLPIMAPLQSTPIPYSQLFPDLGDGYKCIFTNNPSSICAGVVQLYVPLIIAFVLSRLNMAYVIQIGSAALVWFVAAATLPIADIFFAQKWTTLPQIDFTANISIGLVMVVCGLLIYRLSKDPEKRAYTDMYVKLYGWINSRVYGRRLDEY